MPNPSVVLFVANVPRMTRFYQALASMTLIHEDDAHAVLLHGGFELVIHALRGAEPVSPGGTPLVREDSYLKVCLPVDSIARARTAAASLGGAIQPPDREWEGRGFRACDGYDPEGNVVQVRQQA
jgi:predicted enzyme related to lactoylglutathione lyase